MTVAELHRGLSYLIENRRAGVEIFCGGRPVVSVTMSLRELSVSLSNKPVDEPLDADLKLEIDT